MIKSGQMMHGMITCTGRHRIKKTLRKINSLIRDIDRNGYKCTGKPEALSGNLAGFWSVKIDEKNRIVFRLIGGKIEIIQCGSHYRDK